MAEVSPLVQQLYAARSLGLTPAQLQQNQQQQAMAQALIQQGTTPIDTNNRMVGHVVGAVQPLEVVSKLAQQLAGIYEQKDANQQLSDAMTQNASGGQGGYQKTGDPIIDSMSPEVRQQYEQNKAPAFAGGDPKTAQDIYAFQGAGQKKLAESQNTPMQDANGMAYLPNLKPLAQSVNAPAMATALSPQAQGSGVVIGSSRGANTSLATDALSGASNAQQLAQWRQEHGGSIPPSGGGPMPTSMGTQPSITPVTGPTQIPPVQPRDFSAMPPNGADLPSQAQPPLPTSGTMPAVPPELGASNQGKLPPQLMAPDGKPIIPGIENSLKYQPDPTKQTNFVPPGNSAPMGINQAKDIQDQQVEARKQYLQLDSTLSNLDAQKFHAQQLVDIYKDMDSPSAISQYPEIAQKAFNMHLITKTKDIKNLSDVQRALYENNQTVIASLKQAASGLDPNHPMRILQSEVNSNLENAIAPDLTPDARFHNLANSIALIDRNMNAIKAYNSPQVGGLGNRLNAGTTMPPTEFLQHYIAAHEPDVKAAEKAMPVFQGMQQNTQQMMAAPKTATQGFKYLGVKK